MPKVSIIVPVYNTEQYLDRCVQSLQHQTLQDIEIILIDDGSTDQCPEMCDEYAKQDRRIQVIHQINAGAASARNRGLEIATADYVGFVDSDDYVEYDMYMQLYNTAEKYNCDVVLCDCVKEYTRKSVIYTHNIRAGFYNIEQLKKEYYPHLLMMDDISYPPTISNWVLLFKIKKHSSPYRTGNVRYVEGICFSEDLLFGAQLMLNAVSFFYLKGETYYHYCMNSSSITHIFSKKKWVDYMRLINECEKRFLPFKEFDFSKQIDYLVLFFVYNMISDINRTNLVSYREKVLLLKDVLGNRRVMETFRRLNIGELNVSFKQKIYTLFIKIQVIVFSGCMGH